MVAVVPTYIVFSSANSNGEFTRSDNSENKTNLECDRQISSRIGTKISITQKYFPCSFINSWDSQPLIWDIPLDNDMMSSGILFGGGSPAKVLRIMRHMNIITIGYSTFMQHQNRYLHPAVEITYKKQQSTLLEDMKAEGKELILGGDGRCDSPGHSAKYGCYSLMDVEHNKIVESQLVQVCTNHKQLKWLRISAQ